MLLSPPPVFASGGGSDDEVDEAEDVDGLTHVDLEESPITAQYALPDLAVCWDHPSLRSFMSDAS
eukprot:CAMPEP_0171788920 /NCGR_PEP_ID=MMETSP0991-20121206/64783_1 /TAXON_ID=483369 /ORGANISM="non described non described, Strain CCMP2098" /LENGTH=64 /DNA_ID=CAMNT_0012398155 /DNA_START=283 /DNA_END=473 /DNA_ORIENTATION=+